MNISLLILFLEIGNIVCFYLGAKIGQTIVNNKEIKIPDPIKAVTQIKENKEIRKEQEKLNIMLENISNYDGTELGQKDIN